MIPICMFGGAFGDSLPYIELVSGGWRYEYVNNELEARCNLHDFTGWIPYVWEKRKEKEKKMKEHRVMIKCECYSHAIEVEYIEDPSDEITFINLWYDGKRSNTPLLERLKNAYEMVTRGYIIDCFLLNKEKLKQLRDALNIILDER